MVQAFPSSQGVAEGNWVVSQAPDTGLHSAVVHGPA